MSRGLRWILPSLSGPSRPKAGDILQSKSMKEGVALRGPDSTGIENTVYEPIWEKALARPGTTRAQWLYCKKTVLQEDCTARRLYCKKTVLKPTGRCYEVCQNELLGSASEGIRVEEETVFVRDCSEKLQGAERVKIVLLQITI